MQVACITDRKRRRGAVVIWVVLSLGVIIGVVALGMDGGRMLEERRRAIAVADVAALAAASQLFEHANLYEGLDGNYAARDAARAVAAANGYSNDGSTSTVTVNVPPLSGPFAGQPGHVEVLVERRLEPGFGSIFTADDLVVRARAVARGRPKGLGILVLRPTGADAMTAGGSAVLNLSRSGIVVNSNDGQAFSHGGVATINAGYLEVTGNYSANASRLNIGTINTGVPPTTDPLRFLPMPDPAAFPVQSTSRVTVNGALFGQVPPGGGVAGTVLKPGVYQGGIEISANVPVTLETGTYVLEGGGLDIKGLGPVTGDEVLIYNTAGAFPAGPIRITANASVLLTPPRTGPYAGISIIQDRSVSSLIELKSNGVIAIAGTIYAPAAPIEIGGNAILDLVAGSIVCYTLKITGLGLIRIGLGLIGAKVPEVRLVE